MATGVGWRWFHFPMICPICSFSIILSARPCMMLDLLPHQVMIPSHFDTELVRAIIVRRRSDFARRADWFKLILENVVNPSLLWCWSLRVLTFPFVRTNPKASSNRSLIDLRTTSLGMLYYFYPPLHGVKLEPLYQCHFDWRTSANRTVEHVLPRLCATTLCFHTDNNIALGKQITNSVRYLVKSHSGFVWPNGIQ